MRLFTFTLRSMLVGSLLASATMTTVNLAHAGSAPTLRVCSGDPKLRYFKTASDLGEQLRGVVSFDVKPSSGSLDNLRKMASGECDAAIVQSDAYLGYAASTPNASLKFEDVGTLYAEDAQLLCNKSAGIGSLEELRGKPSTKVAIGPVGSGTALTWDALAAKVPAYNKVNTVPLDQALALTRVINGQDAQCLLVVSGLNTAFMKKANDLGNGKIGLVPFNDDAFGKVKDPLGHDVYANVDIPSDAYPNLSPSGTLWGRKPIPTIAVSAKFVLATDWYEKNQATYDDLSTAVNKMGQRLAN